MNSRCRIQAESCSLKCCDFSGECPSTARNCVDYYGENTPSVRRADYSETRRMLDSADTGGGIGGAIGVLIVLFGVYWFCCRRRTVVTTVIY